MKCLDELLERVREDFREARNRDEGDEEKHQAQRRLPARGRRGMLFGTGMVIVRQEVVAVPDGLDEDENAPQHRRDDRYEERLAAAVGADAGRDREVG